MLRIARNPLVILLVILSTVSFLTGDARAGTVMALMVALSVGLRFFQEARADAAAERLRAMFHVTATVLRDGAQQEVALHDLVPGDIVKLAAGDMIWRCPTPELKGSVRDTRQSHGRVAPGRNSANPRGLRSALRRNLRTSAS